LRAAAATPDIPFVLTGDPRSAARPEALQDMPPNVALPGWQPFDEYIDLLRSARVIVCLTTYQKTVQRGAWEAVYLSKPLVTSDTEAQRQCFRVGTVFVSNEASSIARGIRQALRESEQLTEEMCELREAKREEWSVELTRLRALLLNRQGHPAGVTT
jgi:glycosyltransferase involved in cell wall biosynthesis